MIKSTSLVFLFLISLALRAQISNTIFPNNPSQQKKISTSTSNQRITTSDKQRLDSIVSSFDKYAYTYDAAGNQILRVRYEWDDVSNSWVPYNKFEDVYDAAGNATLTIASAWDDATNVYFPDNKYERVYDVNKNQTSEIMYYWNSSSDTWVPTRKFENTFGSNGQISKRDNYSWAGTVLMPDNYIVFTYNNRNLLTEKTQYSPSPSDFMQSQTIYTYDANDNLISEIISNYDYNSNAEMDSGNKYEYTYDSENNLIGSVEAEWNAGIQDWENTYKIDYEFDLQNNPTTIIQSDWDTQTNKWVYSYKNVYDYDLTYVLTDLILPEGFSESLKNKVTHTLSYSFVNEAWLQAAEYTYYYTNLTTTGIVNKASNALTVYPNPATNTVIFTNKTNEAATLELFNQQGCLVYNNAIIMNQPVSVEGMDQGIYFYRISNADAVNYNGTLIIE